MADFFRSFLDFQPRYTSYKLLVVLPSKHPHACLSSSRIRRMNRKPFHLMLFSRPSAAPLSINIVSTHAEHTDGSLVFRFGEPGEAASSVRMEEPNVQKKDIERESIEDDLVVNVLNVDNDGGGKDSGLTELIDESNSIVIDRQSSSIGEEENILDENLMKGATEFELPITVSNVDLKGSSTQGIDMEDTGENQEYLNDEQEISSMKSVPPIFDVISIHEHSDGSLTFRFGDPSEASSNAQLEEPKVEKEGTDEGLIVTDLNGDDEGGVSDSSLAEVTDESNSIVIDGKSLSTSEKENVELGEKGGVSDSSLAEVIPESNSIGNDGKNLSISEKENAELGEKLKDANEFELPTIVSDLELRNSSTPGKDIENDGNDEECLNEERDSSSLMNVSMFEKSSKIEDIIATMAPGLEAGLQFPIGAEAQTSLEGNELRNEIAEDGRESGKIQSMPMYPQLETRQTIDEESVSGDGEEYRDTDKPESLKLEDIPQKSILVSESTEDDDDNVNADMVDLESAGIQVMGMEPTEVAIKSKEIQMAGFVLSSGAALLPHPSKVLTGGEDAYFVSGQTWLGVADGVGQWSFEGTNPGVYAQELIKNCEKLVMDCNGNAMCDPVELLKLGVGETQSPGSSTVLLAQLVGQVLQVANIGDSGFIILRHGSIYKRSSPMLHVFHFPLQIERGDDPSNLAEFYRIDLEEEDVIILASNGLLDNLYDQEIASEVSKYLAQDSKPEEIAEALATKAQEVGRSTSAKSPFADDAQAAGYAGYTGGKLDDVTVIVSMVQKQSSCQAL